MGEVVENRLFGEADYLPTLFTELAHRLEIEVLVTIAFRVTGELKEQFVTLIK